ncbi:MAG: ornithine carbamoyltransferase [Candidatus Omnitrophota bacterium]
MKQDFVSLGEMTPQRIQTIFQEADRLKQSKEKILSGKSLALIFQKPSMRTRVSFEAGMFQLGGQTIYLDPHDIQLGVRESVSDIAKVLSRYVHGIVARTFSHEDVVILAKNAAIPVINGLSDLEHPCQALADLYTIYKVFRRLKGIKIAYVGDGNNVLHSLLQGAGLAGMHLSVASPKGYKPLDLYVREAKHLAKKSGARIAVGHDPVEAVKDADIVYTDVWTSMGQEKEREKRFNAFQGYQVNESLMKRAKPQARFMHCLPAHRGEEVSQGVLDGVKSIVFDQAENRLHVQKAVLAILLG